ncbi:MAG: ComF family protein [Alloprevotella sp.]|nr:ComF family protein [Alloprevotella sp.]
MPALNTPPKWKRLINLLFPSRCPVCGKRLMAGEDCLCTACHFTLPFTQWHGRRGNPAERLFWAKVPVERANAFLRYHPGTDSSHLAHALKYRNRPGIGRVLGRMMAADLQGTDFFDGIDCIVPIPLAKRRQHRRGYNQSEMLARGVAEATGLPLITSAIARIVDNPTQTSLTAQQRAENVQSIFRLRQAEKLADRHVLLIDDVLTTGATLLSCAKEMARASGIRISILTLFVAGRHSEGPVSDRHK